MLEGLIPAPGTTAEYGAGDLASLALGRPGFLLLACLEQLNFALNDLPPESRFNDPYAPGSPAPARAYCDRFDVRPLRIGSISSGGSSRAVEPDDVFVSVMVQSPNQIVVREQLRFGRRSTRQLVSATVAMLLLMIVSVATLAVAVATAGVGWRRRPGR